MCIAFLKQYTPLFEWMHVLLLWGLIGTFSHLLYRTWQRLEDKNVENNADDEGLV